MDKEINSVKKEQPLKFILLLLIVILNVGCDQVSKTVVRQRIDYHQNITLIKNHLTLTKVENTGAFLSAGDNLPELARIILLNVLPILVLVYGLYYLFRQTNLPRTFQLGMCFLIGGGIGNIYDRIKFGSVTDFLHIDFILFRTGIFNLADVSIMIGIGILLLHSFLGNRLSPETV
ncbi:MAG: signal peptidase II [Sphingobacteriaceae bacterium]|nr:signal peptidase II [Sphingobacteriaceae bacterium]